MGRMSWQRSTLVAMSLAVLVMAACRSAPAANKAGGDAAPVTLRIGTMEGPGAPYTEAVLQFARQVEGLSSGSVKIEIVWGAANRFFGVFGPHADQKVAGLVQSGDLDMALIPARAWDELGVTSLQALQAPFLVSTEGLVDQVLKSKIAEQMLAGLDTAGVVGLALLPEGLRHPIGFHQPFLTLRDFAGAKIRTLPSNASDDLIRALGAEPVDTDGNDFSVAAKSGEIAGGESGFAWSNDLPMLGTFTANITFFPKVNVIAANQDVFSGLSADQRSAVQDAAINTVSFVLKTSPTEKARGRLYCDAGGGVAIASESDIAALEHAARSVYTMLEADPQTAAFIEQIRVMKAEIPAGSEALPSACPLSTSTEPTPSATPSGTGGTRTFPEGVYRAHVTYNGDSWIDQLTFEGGHWRDQVVDTAEICVGTYSAADGRIRAIITPACGGELDGGVFMDATWSFANGELRFSDFAGSADLSFSEQVLGAQPWTKIG